MQYYFTNYPAPIQDRTCPNCHHVFEKRHQRNKHLKTKCSQRHECVVCSRLLKNEYSLRVHMQSHEVADILVLLLCKMRYPLLLEMKGGLSKLNFGKCQHCSQFFAVEQTKMPYLLSVSLKGLR